VNPTKPFHSLLRAFRWHRRWFAAILATVAVFATLNVVSQQSSGAVPTVVAIKEIPGGNVLNDTDLAVVRLPKAMVAEGAFDSVDQLVGKEAIITIPARTVLTRSSLLTEGLEVAPGRLALPVKFGDSATMTALSVGSTIDILGQSGDSYTVVASSLRVIAIPNAGQSGVLSSDSAELVMVDVDPTQAGAIATAATAGSLSFALH
jgi:pilus assembly protein CpaB